MSADPAVLQRFAADLDALVEPDARIGVAVSGGADSLALLLLTQAVRPGRVEAASVDHALRAEGRAEAETVAAICAGLGVPHAVLTIEWAELPTSAVQEQARAARYAALGRWAEERRLDAIATGHHGDDQAETLLMRLNRGAGVRGLGAMRAVSTVPGGARRLVRPLLGWRRAELEAVCARAGAEWIEDPSNADPRFERARIRRALADAEWLDLEALARSAAHIAAADQAVEWSVDREWAERARTGSDGIAFRPSGAPPEIVRRLVVRAVSQLASEGAGEPLRGSEIDRLVSALEDGGTATLRGVRCSGGEEWRFAPAPPRARR